MSTANQQPLRLLTINTGSSSLKAALYHMAVGSGQRAAGSRQSAVGSEHDSALSPQAADERRDLAIQVERIGHAGSHLTITDAGGATLLDEQRDLPDHEAALDAVFAWLREREDAYVFDAVGHRVVHGGPRYREPTRVTPELLAALRDLIPIDPDHLPQALNAIETVSRAYPDMPQVACFDTAFHRHMPRVAQRYALPRQYEEAGVIRYGFHGLSCEYIMRALGAADPVGAAGHVIVAHLGNGASMTAVRGGVGIETTMGFSPTGGLVMSTRAGDLDPSVPLYLFRSGLNADDASALLNKQAGLLAVSETSSDMRDLLDHEASDPRTAEAVDLFCYTAKKFVGALAAALGGLETFVFTGGIGEHAAPVRDRICAGLTFLGIHLDPDRNTAHAPIISPDGSPVVVRVLPTDEDLMIARHTYEAVSGQWLVASGQILTTDH